MIHRLRPAWQTLPPTVVADIRLAPRPNARFWLVRLGGERRAKSSRSPHDGTPLGPSGGRRAPRSEPASATVADGSWPPLVEILEVLCVPGQGRPGLCRCPCQQRGHDRCLEIDGGIPGRGVGGGITRPRCDLIRIERTPLGTSARARHGRAHLQVLDADARVQNRPCWNFRRSKRCRRLRRLPAPPKDVGSNQRSCLRSARRRCLSALTSRRSRSARKCAAPLPLPFAIIAASACGSSCV